MKLIETTSAPGAIGPYSQGFITNGLIFTSGQLPADPATGEIPEGIEAQAAQSCRKNTPLSGRELLLPRLGN